MTRGTGGGRAAVRDAWGGTEEELRALATLPELAAFEWRDEFASLLAAWEGHAEGTAGGRGRGGAAAAGRRGAAACLLPGTSVLSADEAACVTPLTGEAILFIDLRRTAPRR